MPFSGSVNEVFFGDGTWKLLPPDSDWQVIGNDMTTIPTGNVGIGVSPTTKLDVDGSIKSRSSLFVCDNLLFEGSGTNKITTSSHNLIFADTRIGFGIDPDPLYTVNIGGDAHVSGCLYVNQGVIIGQRIKGEKGEVDTIRTKEMLVEEKLISKEMLADTVTSLKMLTEKIEAVKDVKVSTITIDGINSKITSTSGSINFVNTSLNTSGTVSSGMLNVSLQANINTLVVNNNITSSTGIINFGENDLTSAGQLNIFSVNSDNLIVGNTTMDNLFVFHKIKLGSNSLVMESLTTE
ncbi:MAG: hypothetical protein HY738_18490, partial [Bacteroidia bacterium]|nr:hypothetical protein [Bacteroidia bacterium]